MRDRNAERQGAWVALLVLAGCGHEQPPERPLVAVRVQPVERTRGSDVSRYSAAIRADVQVDVAFKVNGYVDEIAQVRGADGRRRNLQEGDPVRRGMVLARIRDNEYRDRVAEAQASLVQAKADYERTAKMYENNTVAKADYDAAFARAQASQARYDQTALTLDDCSLRAPLDGVVVRREVEVGTLVNPGSPAFVVANARAVKVVFGVPDVALAAIHMGDTLEVVTEALPGRRLQGLVTRIAPAADPNSRVFDVECTIPNADGSLKMGMIASLRVPEGARRSVLTLVPLGAIVRPKDDPQGYAVFVVEAAGDKTIARLRPVQLGDVVGNSIAVTEGLAGGERIVVTGASYAVDGEAVNVVP
jgi:RND family efflux transporter MFP subunit